MARTPRSKDRVPLEKVRWQLCVVWFSGGASLFLLLIVQSLTGVYEQRVQGVWGWALPNFLPTLSLMIGVFAATALKEHADSDDMRVRRPFARLAVALSLFHLACVILTLLAHPFAGTFMQNAEGEVDMMSVFDLSSLWLAPLQGLVAAAIGALFFLSESGAPASREIPEPNPPQP